jgi:hypothetical protein
MQTIITQPGQHAHPNPDAAARLRKDRLAKATADQMESALAFLSMIDPEAFEIAFTAVTPGADPSEDAEAIPLCRRCGALVATHETHNPGHAAEVTWILPDETPEEF